MHVRHSANSNSSLCDHQLNSGNPRVSPTAICKLINFGLNPIKNPIVVSVKLTRQIHFFSNQTLNWCISANFFQNAVNQRIDIHFSSLNVIILNWCKRTHRQNFRLSSDVLPIGESIAKTVYEYKVICLQ